MTSIAQQARVMEAADRDAAHEWPLLSPAEAQEAIDAAWTLYVALYRAERGDPAVHRANYKNQIAMIKRAAGYWA